MNKILKMMFFVFPISVYGFQDSSWVDTVGTNFEV